MEHEEGVVAERSISASRCYRGTIALTRKYTGDPQHGLTLIIVAEESSEDRIQHAVLAKIRHVSGLAVENTFRPQGGLC